MENTSGAANNISWIGSESDNVSQQITSTAVVREDVTSGTTFNIDAELAVLFDEPFADNREAPRIPSPAPILGMGGDRSEEDEIPELLTDDDMPELGPLSPWSSPATSFRDLDEESSFAEGQTLTEEIIAELARLHPIPDTSIPPRGTFPTPNQLRAISELIIVEYTRRGADGHEIPPDSDSDDNDWYSSDDDDDDEDMYSEQPFNSRDANTQGSLSQGRNQPNVPVPQSPMPNDASGSDINDANPPPLTPLRSFREEMWRTRRMFAHRSLLIKLELADLEDTYDAVDPPQYPNLSLIENALALSLTCTAHEDEEVSVRATNEEYRPPQPNPEYKSISPPYSAPPDIPNPEVHQFFPLPPA